MVIVIILFGENIDHSFIMTKESLSTWCKMSFLLQGLLRRN